MLTTQNHRAYIHFDLDFVYKARPLFGMKAAVYTYASQWKQSSVVQMLGQWIVFELDSFLFWWNDDRVKSFTQPTFGNTSYHERDDQSLYTITITFHFATSHNALFCSFCLSYSTSMLHIVHIAHTHQNSEMLKCSSFNITARVIEHTEVSGFTITYPVKFDLLQII